MRKFFLSILLVIIARGNAFSQTSERLHSFMSHKHYDEIVRTYHYPEAIVFGFDALYSDSFVSLKNNVGVLKERYIFGCHIHDFVISDDTVFFCGENKTGSGIIGFFDIDDYFNHSGDYTILDTLPIIGNYYAANLTKLVTYFDDNNRRHVFALGYTNRPDFEEKFGCVIDWLGDIDYMAYNAGYVYKSTEREFLDVDIVDKYLVTVGYDNPSGVDIRVFDKNNPFSSTGPQNIKHRMVGNPENGYYRWNGIDALVTDRYTDINNYTFAIASIYEQVVGQFSTGWKVHLAELNVNSIVAHSLNTILTSRRLTATGYNTPLKLRELRYTPIDKRYSILYQAKNPITEQVCNVFSEMSNNFDTFIMGFRDSNDIESNYYLNFVSFDQFKSQHKYLLVGNENDEISYTDLSEDIYFQIETSGLQSYCLPNLEFGLSDVRNIGCYYIESLMISFGQRAVPNRVPVYHTHPYYLDEKCSNEESYSIEK